MENKMEPKEFKIENWGKEIVEKMYQVGLIGLLHKFNGYNEKITQEFISHYEQGQTTVGDLAIPLTQNSCHKL